MRRTIINSLFVGVLTLATGCTMHMPGDEYYAHRPTRHRANRAPDSRSAHPEAQLRGSEAILDEQMDAQLFAPGSEVEAAFKRLTRGGAETDHSILVPENGEAMADSLQEHLQGASQIHGAHQTPQDPQSRLEREAGVDPGDPRFDNNEFQQLFEAILASENPATRERLFNILADQILGPEPPVEFEPEPYDPREIDNSRRISDAAARLNDDAARMAREVMQMSQQSLYPNSNNSSADLMSELARMRAQMLETQSILDREADAREPNEMRAQTREPHSRSWSIQDANVRPTAGRFAMSPPPPGQWREDLHEVIETLRTTLATPPKELTKVEASRLMLTLSLLHLLAQDREQALAQIDALDENQRGFWKEQLFALGELLRPDDMDLDSPYYVNNRRGAIAGQHLRQSMGYLANNSSLQVGQLTLCKSLSGYGAYEEFDSRAFNVGDEVLIYCELENLTAVSSPGARHQLYLSEIQGTLEVVDSNGRVVNSQKYETIRDEGRKRRLDFYVHFRWAIPELPPGDYSLRLTIADLQGDKIAAAPSPVEFRIRSR